MPPLAYPDPLEVGSAPYTRRYVRRPGELLIRFADGVTDDVIAGILVAEGLDPYVEPLQRFWAMRAAGMRWVRWTGADEDLRDFARLLLPARPEVDDATPVFQPRDGDEGEAASPIPGDLLVRIEPGRVKEVIASLAARDLLYRPQVSARLASNLHLFRVAASRPGDDGFDLIAAAQEVVGRQAVEHDWLKIETYHGFPPDPPNDQYWKDQWNLSRIGMLKAWEETLGAPAVRVAVIDSGFDLDHPDLAFSPIQTRLDVEELWRDDGISHDAGPSSFPHGTPVAGIAAAQVDNNKVGIAGVAGGCRVLPIRVGPAPSSGRVALALAWARTTGARVVNMSLTTVESSTLVAEVDQAWSSGMVLCAAAGNAGMGIGARGIGFPARHQAVIGVGASDADDGRKTPASPDKERWESRWGEGLDVIAPGVDLWSTDELGPAGWNSGNGKAEDWFGVVKSRGDSSGDYLAVFGGTSGATPHVAGLAALLLVKHPGLSNSQVRHVIERTCRIDKGRYPDVRPHPERTGTTIEWHPEVGCGLINAASALTNAVAISGEPMPELTTLSNPCALDDCVVFVGYLGRGPAGAAASGNGADRGDLWRIYERITLDRWIEVYEDDIRWTEPVAGGSGGTRVWVARGAPIRRVMTVSLTAAPSPLPF